MYFKKLEIFGFKSFADKTVLNFEPGITAIVGPNGCGKSNIFDAIRWVLGEQSVKELRGDSMEDVIFNGTASKPSLGFAEVSLSFDNESRMLNIEYDEVTITRRLFRSGESEYLLNKNIMRLRDIQELLMGTGIGAEAYSLVQQGKVDLVVSARPEDRRMIFDEASGITKYKAKKREALNKLKDTENNLLRVNDITVEVKRQIASIERQANKARKYKVEYERLKEMEVKLARHQIGSYSEHKNRIRAKFDEMKNKETQIRQELAELSDLLNNEINYLSELELKISELHSDEIKLDGQVDLNNRQIGFNQERIESLNHNEQKLTQKKEELIERCREQQEKLEGFRQALFIVEETLRYNEQRLGEKRELLTRLERSIAGAKRKIQEHEEKILSLTSSQVSVRNELTDMMKESQGAIARKRRLEMENRKVLMEKSESDQKLDVVNGQINTVRETMDALKTDKTNRLSIIEESKVRLSQLDGQISQLEKKCLSLKSQKEFIEKLHAQYEDIPDPVIEGRIITQTPPLDHHTGILGKVKEVSLVNAGQFEYLKGRLGLPEAKQLYEIICETKFIELDPQQISIKIEELNYEISTLAFQKENLENKLREQRGSLEMIDAHIHSAEKEQSILEAQKKDMLTEAEKLAEELILVDTELQEVNGTLETLKKKEEELNYLLDTVSQDIGWCQNDIKARQVQVAVQSQEKEEILVAIAQLETEIESSKDKLRSEQEHQELFMRDLDKSLEEIKQIDDEVSEQGRKRTEYELGIETLQEKIKEIGISRQSLRGNLTDYETQKEDLGQRMNSSRLQMKSLEEEIDQINQRLHEEELEDQKLGFNEQDIKNRLFQTYKIDFDQAVAQQDLEARQRAESEGPQPEEAVNIEALIADVDLLRKRCDSFGSVNLVAIEEFEELKERFEFLTKQQSDLLEAKSQLMNTIQKINRSTRQMFMDTFNKVGEEFRIYFRTLFGGGEADLILLDPENVLESGIEIVAKPPGKKLQNISLLSGGEKTLTAIALIFGVFKVNPSPFCVLDEIDAALDDSNVGRFNYLLKEFSKIAQFIVITHNKKTIASSDVMYGITMPETGISRIVSVKFSEDKEKQEELVEV
ncbi:MAG: AAA family ATPase [Candidatus Omnitrophica bacterium]|nr:AAA family ATPase [Candidatus Omnitrophota bacterium]